MKVAISVGGRFHLFNLAQQLLKRNSLSQLITSYPKFEVVKYGIPKSLVSSIIIKEILDRGWRHLPGFLQNLYNPQYFIHEIFDRAASWHIKPADIVVGGSSVYLHTMKKVKEFGGISVLERGSSHMLYQNEILKEEYEKYGVKITPYKLPHKKVIEKELIEYEETDYISIPSSYVKRTFLEKGIPESKIIQVPYGVDISHFHQIPKKDNVFRVVFVGGMSLRKGVHYLLKAFSELKLPNSELFLIGSMNDEIKPFFKKYVTAFRRGPTESGKGQIVYIGHVLQNELYKYYSQGSVFAIMSIEEGLAMVQPQAMACGLPVICTTNTGGEDIVRDGKDGFVIPIRDINKLKEKLVYLYKNKDVLEKMGKSAKERVSAGFTWDDYGIKIISEYKRILSRNGKKNSLIK